MPSIDLLSPGELPALVCRPALPLDAAGVMDMARHIWNGHDYIPYVWADWLADADGLMAAAEFGGRIVGLGKVTRLDDAQWWLEGMRVHPEFEGRGFARHIFNYLMAYWEARCGGAARLITSAKNVKIHHLCEGSGFQKIGELAFLGAPALAEPLEALRPLDAADLPEALAVMQRTPPLTYGLVDYHWKWGAASADGLGAATRGGKAWEWRDGAGLLTWWEDEDDGLKLPILEMALCPPDDVLAYLLDFRRLAAHLGYEKAYWMAPLRPELRLPLINAGFSEGFDDVAFLYERQQAQMF